MKPITAFTLFLATLPTLPGPTQGQVRGNLWDSAQFREYLQYSFAVNRDIEPPLNEQETTVYNDIIVPLIGSNPAEAEKQILEYLAQFPDASPLFAFTLGNIYFQQNKRAEAEVQFLQAIEKFKNFKRAHQNLGTLYVQMGEPTKAIPHLTRVVELGGSDGVLFGLLGVAYVTIEQFIPAEIAFRQAILLKPETPDWKLGLARSLLAQQRYGEVVALMDQMIGDKPDDAMLWSLQTSAYIGLKNTEAAAANLEILKGLGKADAKLLSTLSDIYVNQGLLDLAAQNYIDSFEAGGGMDTEGLLRAAQILLDRKSPNQAERIVTKAREVAEQTKEPKFQLEVLRLQAKLAEAQGKADDAAKLLEEIVAKDGLDGASLLALGKYYAETDDRDGKKQTEKAELYYQRAQNIEPFEADANLRLAQLYVGQGKYNEAIPLLKRAQDLKPRESVAKFLDDLERYNKGRR